MEGGAPELVNLDVIAQAGGATRAIDRTFPVTVTDGILDVVFSSTVSRV
ncbi:malectin domain-containing carbohydrate-binding protein [Cytophagaceae bacterium DM2B3-1]|uniref:Malectin domain-containing carbohydrate-binding protein n=1 Tax=Xanthocytophaga flava TaxID=3048013 RepID=A0ABT7CH58_9BACT|nr:malectin domain-containing carbohydrate-binding protein [Xanthocytophaga flavus]MDJ1493083.1 malectin domain-containing carbohydrate-binding protein [Xanthocytophaga flavus]